jgi:hypothetical protein
VFFEGLAGLLVFALDVVSRGLVVCSQAQADFPATSTASRKGFFGPEFALKKCRGHADYAAELVVAVLR